MFDVEKVQSLNELEMVVYRYIIEHFETLGHLTIRELAEAAHVSTSTILRTLSKLGFDGFSDFKYFLKEERLRKQQSIDYFYDATVQVNLFLKKLNDESYQTLLAPAVEMILNSRHILFTGIGTSGMLGAYGSRYFTNLELNAYSLSDPFAPIPPRGLENTLVILLSVSGETDRMIEQLRDFKRYGAKTLSITNDEHSPIARLSDYNISYLYAGSGEPPRGPSESHHPSTGSGLNRNLGPSSSQTTVTNSRLRLFVFLYGTCF